MDGILVSLLLLLFLLSHPKDYHINNIILRWNGTHIGSRCEKISRHKCNVNSLSTHTHTHKHKHTNTQTKFHIYRTSSQRLQKRREYKKAKTLGNIFLTISYHKATSRKKESDNKTKNHSKQCTQYQPICFLLFLFGANT